MFQKPRHGYFRAPAVAFEGEVGRYIGEVVRQWEAIEGALDQGLQHHLVEHATDGRQAVQK